MLPEQTVHDIADFIDRRWTAPGATTKRAMGIDAAMRLSDEAGKPPSY